jgi:flavorubredoxin
MVSLNDLCDRMPVALTGDQVLDLGSHRLRHIDTPHVPHGWEARVLFDETTNTLLAGDLFSNLGDPAPVTSDDIVGAAGQAEDMFSA